MTATTMSPPRLSLTSGERGLIRLLERSGLACEVRFADGGIRRFGAGRATFRLVLSPQRKLRRIVSEFSFARAYVEGDFDIEGDILTLLNGRPAVRDTPRFAGFIQFWGDLFLRRATALNKYAVDWHYSFGDDFYHTFIDREHHFYSHGVFHSEDETIEQASTHKLEQMFEALKLKPGMHLLDIGGGWGPVTNYCCKRGVRVSTVTIAPDSHTYIHDMIQKNHYDAAVYREDFLTHRPAQPYAAIVIYGVIEHIPRYRRFFKRVWDNLRPDGLFYLDGSAALQKYETSNFTKHYIWRGTHSFMCLQDVIEELLFNGFDLLRVQNETRDYELTLKEWATRLEANQQHIIEKWGERTYRAFRVYLWGGCHSMHVHDLQAYHLVARRRDDPGPRPGNVRRFKNFVAGLR